VSCPYLSCSPSREVIFWEVLGSKSARIHRVSLRGLLIPALVLGGLEDAHHVGLLWDKCHVQCSPPRIPPVSTFVSWNLSRIGWVLSAAITRGLVSRLKSDSSLVASLETNRRCLAPEAVRTKTIYTHLGIPHAYPIGAGHSPSNHTRSVVSRSMPRYIYLLLGTQTLPNHSADLVLVTDIP
jgi:hypothetical protein